MLKVILFDVGETLIHNGIAIPGVITALTEISKLKTSDDKLIQIGIVSNYYPPAEPVTEAAIATLEKKYRTEILEPAGLAPYFLPFDERVTLSTRAGKAKPDKEIFLVALKRLQTTAKLSECIFVTEDEVHLNSVKEYGMVPVGFGNAIPDIITFLNWSAAPLLVASLLSN